MIVYFLRKHDVLLILLIRHISFTLIFAKAKPDLQYTNNIRLNIFWIIQSFKVFVQLLSVKKVSLKKPKKTKWMAW